MDLLDFEAEQLYFDEPMDAGAREAIDTAAQDYGTDKAEPALLRAYFLAPEHPVVLVALYRYFYYQHRYDDALRIAERVIALFARRLGFPEDWRTLDQPRFENGVLVSMTLLRFYMLALKGAGYLELRLGCYSSAQARLQKVAEFDENDRMGAQALLEVVRESIGNEQPRESARA